MSNWSKEAMENALKELYKRASTDKEFRQLCLSQPEEAVKQVSDQVLPAGFTLRFVDNEGADATFVLPEFLGESELSDEQLEAVAGGKKKKNKDKDDDDDDDFVSIFPMRCNPDYHK